MPSVQLRKDGPEVPGLAGARVDASRDNDSVLRPRAKVCNRLRHQGHPAPRYTRARPAGRERASLIRRADACEVRSGSNPCCHTPRG